VLAQEAFELQAAGARPIQIDEPALPGAPEDLELAARALKAVTGELNEADSILATYFFDAKRLGAQLFELPVGGFGLDLVAGPENLQLAGQVPPSKELQAGIVDARNTRLETVEDLSRVIDRLMSERAEGRLSVSPSAGLEFLPREKARAKLHRLVDASRKASS